MFNYEIATVIILVVLSVCGVGIIKIKRRKPKAIQDGTIGKSRILSKVHLKADPNPEWVEEEEVQTLTGRLIKSGFAQHRSVIIEEKPDVRLLFLIHVKSGIIAEIRFHQEHGLSLSFSTMYKNGDVLTVSDSPLAGTPEQRPGSELICLPEAGLGRMVTVFKKAIKPGPRLSVNSQNLEDLWVDLDYQNRKWRRERDLMDGEGPGGSPVDVPLESGYLESEDPITTTVATLVAKVVLDRAEMPGVKALSKSMKPYFRKGPKPSKFKLENGIIVFNLPGGSGAVTLLPHPILEKDITTAIRDATHWPEAENAVKDHAAHLIVTINVSRCSLVDRNLLLMRVTAAVAQAAGGGAVYWCANGLLFDPKIFRETSLGMTKETLPLAVWINFRIRKNDNGGHSLQTRGLSAFNLMEIEIVDSPHQPGEMKELASILAAYLIDNGPVIKNGDTFGPNQKTRIVITHESSITDSSREVYRLRL